MNLGESSRGGDRSSGQEVVPMNTGTVRRIRTIFVGSRCFCKLDRRNGLFGEGSSLHKPRSSECRKAEKDRVYTSRGAVEWGPRV